MSSAKTVFEAQSFEALHVLRDEIALAWINSAMTGVPVAIKCRTRKEAQLIRARLYNIQHSRIEWNCWYDLSTHNTREEPEIVYARARRLDVAGVMRVYGHWGADAIKRTFDAEPLLRFKPTRLDRRIFEVLPS